jgi:tellurite resistance-related uncharacterized protein
MDYRTALEIARRNPGISVCPAQSGGYVLRHQDGSLFTSPDGAIAEDTTPSRLSQNLQYQYEQVFAQLGEAYNEISARDGRLQQLQSQLNGERANRAVEIKALDEEKSILTKRIQHLEARIAKVSPDEWERIKFADETEKAERASALRAVRRTLSCACLGEVENCIRCSGRGSYTTDGYGNIV